MWIFPDKAIQNLFGILAVRIQRAYGVEFIRVLSGSLRGTIIVKAVVAALEQHRMITQGNIFTDDELDLVMGKNAKQVYHIKQP